MSSRDEYVDLCIEARDALRAVIAETEPGTGWTLHGAYAELRACIERGGAPPSRRETAKERGERERQEQWERRRAWKTLPDEARDRAALQALGDERLTIRETQARMAEILTDCDVYETDARRTLLRLVDAGDVAREPEAFKGKTRYRYFRTTDLRGPIADLDRQFRDAN